MFDKSSLFMENSIKICYCVSSTKLLHDVVVEDLLWNSLIGNVSKQRAKDTPLEDLVLQKKQIEGITGQAYPSKLSRRFKNYAENPFAVSLDLIHIKIIVGGKEA